MQQVKTQFLKYVVIGVCTNAALYGIYLLLTKSLMSPKFAMTTLYSLGIVLSFAFNRIWTFQHRGHGAFSLARFIVAYAAGYVINFLALTIFVDRLNFAHEWVQAVMAVFLAFFLFTLQKLWVFREAGR